MKKGKVQAIYRPTATTKEQNWVYSFAGFWQLLRLVWRLYRGNPGPAKLYVFFD